MILGIIGNRGSGKSTLADMIKELVPGAVDIALADPLKRFCREVFDFTDEQLYGPSEARNAPDTRYQRPARGSYLTPREALQKLGTEWGRACYEDVWIDAGIRRAKALLGTPIGTAGAWHPCSLVLITDVRFLNESRGVTAAGGKLVRITRTPLNAAQDAHFDAHASETEQRYIEAHYTIHNTGTLDELREKTRRLATDLPRLLGETS